MSFRLVFVCGVIALSFGFVVDAGEPAPDEILEQVRGYRAQHEVEIVTELAELRIGISFWAPPGLPSSSELQTPPRAIIRASRARRTGHGRPLRPLSTGTSSHDPS